MTTSAPEHSCGPDRRGEQAKRDQARIDTFVVRARRIAAHSLAQDEERLEALARGTMTLTVTTGEPMAVLSMDYPPEEQVESAAARVRPLLLQDVSMLSVLRSITSATAGSPDRERVREWAARVRTTWKLRTDEITSQPGFIAIVENTETGEQGVTDGRALALAWIYGDVVHHDPEHLERTRLWNVGDRYRAAVSMVAYMMLTSMRVLESIRELEARGHLTVSPEAWSIEVVAESHYEREAAISVGNPGAKAPTSASDPLPEGWHPLTVTGPS